MNKYKKSLHLILDNALLTNKHRKSKRAILDFNRSQIFNSMWPFYNAACYFYSFLQHSFMFLSSLDIQAS